jgi:2-phospho-L-lactate guanylyltransferase
MDAEARAKLARQLFLHVFATIRSFAETRDVIVVSRAPEILALAATDGAVALEETSAPDLNAALEQAARFARDAGAMRLLVVASDLPLLSSADVEAMTRNDCAIAPDRHRRGTNALLWPANPLLGFFFGEDSFAHHKAAARAIGFDPRIVSRPGLAHDVDMPEDLADLSR